MPSIQQHKTTDGPLYRRIQDALRDQIIQGKWEKGKALPSRRALCLEFGTTRVTLDKAINELVREGWLRSEAGSGTFVSTPGPTVRSRAPRAMSGRNARSLRIGVVLGRHTPTEAETEPGAGDRDPQRDNFFLGPLSQGIGHGLSGKPVDVTYSHVEDGDFLGAYRRSTLDGMLLVAPSLEDLPALRQLAAAAVPFVAIAISSRAHPEDGNLPCVDSDNRQGAADAVQHLLDLGHRRIALVNLALSHANHFDRLEGYQRTLATAGVAVRPDDLVLYPEYWAETFEPRVEEWLARIRDRDGLPTAILACDYFMTLVTVRVLRRQGIRVPEDVSVVGFDDPISAADLTPPLTTVRQPTYRLGRRAAARLVQHLQEGTGAPLRGTELLPNELVIRASTSRPRTDEAGREAHR